MTSTTHSHALSDDPALRRRLLALARHWLGQGQDAEDLLQDAWLRVADGPWPAELASREAWLVTVLRHLCIDAVRRRRLRQKVLGHLAGNDGGEASHDQTPERLAEQAQSVQRVLDHLIRRLPAGDVALFLLYQAFDFSHAELGELAGRSEAATRQRLHRLLRRLRQRPAAESPAEDSPYLLALCQWALAQRDPAGLVAVLRSARPQALALPAHLPGSPQIDRAGPPAARLIQVGDRLALLTEGHGGLMAWLNLGEAIGEPA